MIINKKYFNLKSEVSSKLLELMNLAYHFFKTITEQAIKRDSFKTNKESAGGFYSNRVNFKIKSRFIPLRVEADAICIYCSECERICPTQALEVFSASRSKNKDKTKDHNKIILDISKCISCGLCTPICPTNYLEIRKINLDDKSSRLNLENNQFFR